MAIRRWLRALEVTGTATVLTLASLSSLAAAEGSGTPATPAPGWSAETVESAGSVGFYSSLAYSPVTGFPAIAYSDEGKDDVKLATWNGASWSIQTVDAGKGVAQVICLAFDAAGNPALSYGLGPLKFARWTGASWTIQTIDIDANTVGSLAFKDGQPSVAYGYSARIKGKTYNQLKLARLVGSSWVSEIVEDGVTASYKSLAYAPDGNPSIAYRDGDTSKFAHKTGSTWTIQTVETGGAGVFISLAYDPLTGYPTVSYRNDSATNLRFVRWDGSLWVVEIVATGMASYSSMAYDSAGIAAISYGCLYHSERHQPALDRAPDRLLGRLLGDTTHSGLRTRIARLAHVTRICPDGRGVDQLRELHQQGPQVRHAGAVTWGSIPGPLPARAAT